MEKLIYELILEVKNLKNSVNNIEEKLERIEKELDVYSIDIANKNEFIPCKVNSKYLFENMVVGKNNELAYKSALEVAKSPG